MKMYFYVDTKLYKYYNFMVKYNRRILYNYEEKSKY